MPSEGEAQWHKPGREGPTAQERVGYLREPRRPVFRLGSCRSGRHGEREPEGSETCAAHIRAGTLMTRTQSGGTDRTGTRGLPAGTTEACFSVGNLPERTSQGPGLDEALEVDDAASDGPPWERSEP